MPRRLQIEIVESAETLEKQLKHARTASQKERLQMLWWFKTGQVSEHQQLARQLGRDPATITRWLQKYRQGGMAELLKVKSARGKQPQITPEALAGLQQQLSERGFTSYGEIVDWLKHEYGLELSYAVVYDWVHYRLKAKLKVPRPQSAKQDKAAVEQFKKTLLQQ
jgi:transposase